MLNELEDTDPREAINDFGEADRCCLEDWPREGQPFRNIVLEYLQRAREAGTDAEAGFCAVISDLPRYRLDRNGQPRRAVLAHVRPGAGPDHLGLNGKGPAARGAAHPPPRTFSPADTSTASSEYGKAWNGERLA